MLSVTEILTSRFQQSFAKMGWIKFEEDSYRKDLR